MTVKIEIEDQGESFRVFYTDSSDHKVFFRYSPGKVTELVTELLQITATGANPQEILPKIQGVDHG